MPLLDGAALPPRPVTPLQGWLHGSPPVVGGKASAPHFPKHARFRTRTRIIPPFSACVNKVLMLLHIVVVVVRAAVAVAVAVQRVVHLMGVVF